jgi:DNA-binding beta-propeller fold protein YncE
MSGRGLYDSSGKLLFAVKHKRTVGVSGKEYRLHVSKNGQTLTVKSNILVSDQDKKCIEYTTHCAEQISARKRDMKALQTDIDTKQVELELDEDIDNKKVGDGLLMLFALRGKHAREIESLEKIENAVVSYTQTNETTSVTLKLNQLTQVGFFTPQLVMYRHGPLVTVKTKRKVVETRHPVVLSAWQAERLTGRVAATIAGDASLTRSVYPRSPSCVVVSHNRVFVGDVANSCVLVYTKTGAFVMKIGQEVREDDDNIAEPRGVAIAGELLFVSDATRNRLTVFDKNTGVFVRHIADGSMSEVLLRSPQGIAVAGNRVFIADSLNNRVVVFELEGAFVRIACVQSMFETQTRCPTHVQVSMNRVYVIYKDQIAIYAFDLQNKLLYKFASWQPRLGQYWYPKGMTVAGNRIFVVYPEDESVSVFLLDGRFVNKLASYKKGDAVGDLKVGLSSVAVHGSCLCTIDSKNNNMLVCV